jgi:trigger factor
MGSSVEEYLKGEGQTEEELTVELTQSATKAVRIQLVLDAIADDKDLTVSDEDFGQEIVQRAQQAGVAPQQYYDQIVRAGVAGAVYGDVRRGKALATVVESIKITDSAGVELNIDELRDRPAADEPPAE